MRRSLWAWRSRGAQPTVAAIEAGKEICLANKETLIAAGPVIVPLCVKHGVRILPADSEHSAIFQCIQGLPEGGLRRGCAHYRNRAPVFT